MKALLRAVVRLAVEIFFGELAVLGRDRIPPGVPVMLCPNHPSAGMDALLLGAVFGHRVHYIAKSGLFGNPLLGAVLRWLGAIPIHRRQDAAGTAPGESNQEAFAAATAVLARGDWLAIFPEGTSIATGRLQPLKTGAARIALQAESEHGFALGLHVVPVGLAYSAATIFRSQVAVAVGAPIRVADWADRYAADPQAAARALTAAIDEGIREELAYVPGDSLANLAQAIEAIYETEGLVGDEMADRLAARDVIKHAVLHYAQTDPGRVERVSIDLSRYRRKLSRLRLTDRVVATPVRPSPRRAWLFLELLLEAPAALYGFLNHLVPYNVPRAVLRLSDPDPAYVSTVKLATGIVSFLACYAVQTWLVYGSSGSAALAAAYAVSLPLSGILALHYASRVEHARDQIAIVGAVTLRRRRRVLEELASERRRIVTALEASRREWETQVPAEGTAASLPSSPPLPGMRGTPS